MKSANSVVLGTGLLCVALATSMLSAQKPAPAPATPGVTKPAAAPAGPTPVTSRAAAPVQDHNAVIKQYCVGCHNPRSKAGGLELDAFDINKVVEHAAVGERMITKLQAGMMPPPGSRRPDAAVLTNVINALESKI